MRERIFDLNEPQIASIRLEWRVLTRIPRAILRFGRIPYNALLGIGLKPFPIVRRRTQVDQGDGLQIRYSWVRIPPPPVRMFPQTTLVKGITMTPTAFLVHPASTLAVGRFGLLFTRCLAAVRSIFMLGRSHRATCLLVLLFFALFAGCTATGSIQQTPGGSALSSPLPEGVFSGTVDCKSTTIDASGAVSTQTIPLEASFEIDQVGIPVIQGSEIRVGRTVAIGGLQGTYTRIHATTTGLVIQGNATISVGSSTGSGSSIAELSTNDSGGLDYRLTLTLSDDTGATLNQSCTGVLSQ